MSVLECPNCGTLVDTVGTLELGLTKRQRECLEIIRQHRADHGISPSYEELAVAMGMAAVSKGAVHRLITSLIERGHVRRDPHCARSVIPVREQIAGAHS